MDLRHLRYLAAVAASGSFSRAVAEEQGEAAADGRNLLKGNRRAATGFGATPCAAQGVYPGAALNRLRPV